MPPVNYTIRPFRESDLGAVLWLWKDRFGEVPQQVRDDLNDRLTGLEDGRLHIRNVTCRVIVGDDRNLHGFVIARAGSGYELARTLKGAIHPDEMPNSAGLISEIAVSREVEGMGLASELLENIEPWFLQNHAGRVFTISWRRDQHDSYDLFTSQGYEEVAHAEEFFEQRTACPDCGQNCTCDATILRKEADADANELSRSTCRVQLRATPEYGARRVPDV